jgi:hypothetical protein
MSVELTLGEPQTTRWNTAVGREVDRGDLDLLPTDVVPDVEHVSWNKSYVLEVVYEFVSVERGVVTSPI